MRIRHEVIVEREIEGVHAAIADGGNGLAGEPSVGFLPVVEFMSVVGGFFNQQHRETEMPERWIRGGARHDHDQARTACKGAPGFRAVQQPAARGFRRLELHMGDIRTIAGFGDRDGAQRIAGGDSGQPLVLLLGGAARQQRAG